MAIAAGKQKELRLGNLEACRDWGYAPDYVEAMWLMLDQDEPGMMSLPPGRCTPCENSLRWRLNIVGLNYINHVVIDQEFYRPAEVDQLIGNAEKATKRLGWRPKTSFESWFI